MRPFYVDGPHGISDSVSKLKADLKTSFFFFFFYLKRFRVSDSFKMITVCGEEIFTIKQNIRE